MQGSGVSSLSQWTAFDTESTADFRTLAWGLYISWQRVANRDTFATVGTSLVNGTDLIQGQTSVITKQDVFTYKDETDNVIQLEYDRQLQEPLGGISLSQCDVTLDNTSKRFTPDYNGTIGTAILPNRPIQMFLGFNVNSTNTTLPIFKGLSDQPQENKLSRTVRIHSYDYLKYLNQFQLETAVYIDQRSDQIIADILDSVGFSADQYVLDEGLNTIGYAYFSKGKKAGLAIREICEAEEGVFFQDEQGLLRFQNRRKFSEAPYNSVVWTIDNDDIIDWQQTGSTKIINSCTVKAEPREVKASQEVWRDIVVEEIPANSSITVWANFDNPVTSFEAVTSTTDYTANAQSDGGGADKTANLSVSATNFTTSSKLILTNSDTSTIYVTFLRLRGTPAIIKYNLEEVYEDDTSISKYETQRLEIENNFIDDEDFAYYYARAIVTKYAEPMRQIKIRIRGVPQLQLRDKVSVYDRDLLSYKNYRIMGIKGILRGASFYQDLTLREVTAFEADSWAIVGEALVDGADFVGS